MVTCRSRRALGRLTSVRVHWLSVVFVSGGWILFPSVALALGCSSSVAHGVALGHEVIGAGCSVESPLWVFGDVELVDGGVAESYALLFDGATMTVDGGSIESDLDARGDSAVNIQRGVLASYLHAEDQSNVYLSGGSLASYIWVDDSARLHLFGSNFKYDPRFFGAGAIAQWIGTLSGTLQDGTRLSHSLRVAPAARVYANGRLFLGVPEPGSAVLTATVASCLWFCRRRWPASNPRDRRF